MQKAELYQRLRRCRSPASQSNLGNNTPKTNPNQNQKQSNYPPHQKTLGYGNKAWSTALVLQQHYLPSGNLSSVY